ncbi:hypothetical protein GCM10017690_10050 [Microbacterium terregens]
MSGRGARQRAGGVGRNPAKVVTSATMSLDGFVAYDDNDPGALFDWYEAGDVETVNAGSLPPFHLTRESADYWREWTSQLGCLVVAARSSTSPTAGVGSIRSACPSSSSHTIRRPTGPMLIPATPTS